MKRFTAPLCALALFVFGAQAPASAELIYGTVNVGTSTTLVTFDSAAPNNLLSATFLTAFNGSYFGGTIVGLDFRPASRQLYALTANGGLLTVNTATGATLAVGGPNPNLNGVNFGFDFNPTIDRARIVSDVNKNIVMNPITGAVQLVATDLAYGPSDPNFGVDPNVVSSAYSNNIPTATTSQLYGIDSGLDILVTQANNTGTLGTVGPLGVNVVGAGGFDISGTSGIAYAAFQPANSAQSSLYTINLATGAATSVGVIGSGFVLQTLTVAPAIPEPATLGLVAMALVAAPLVRRRK
ncbi:DUF4394 domain-containing protein [Lacipirellula sp.]|uniref:DUF4394 domain-containing protein n=1 Tax=Lacipirellula sp. TaxID=2691419 RepID=UPI003D150A2C